MPLRVSAPAFVLSAALVSGAAESARAGTAIERTEAFLAALGRVRVRPDVGELTEAERGANRAAFRALDEFFDFDRIVGEPIAPYRERFSPAQLATFSHDFREVIRLAAFPASSRALAGARHTLKNAPGRHGDAFADVLMSVRFEGEKRDAAITFHWFAGQGTWRIYDLSIDGASLVETYRQQFGRMLEQGSAEIVLQKLAARLEEKRRERLTLP